MAPSRPWTPLPRALVLLVAFIAGAELLLELADRGILFDPTLRMRVFQVGAFWSSLLGGGHSVFPAQPITMFVSHALLHGGFLHMAMNMTILLALGRFTADTYGPGAVLPVFLAGAVTGGLFFGLLASQAFPMVGASGAVFAFIGVWTVWDWKRRVRVGASAREVVRRVMVLVGLNLVMYFGLGGMLAWQAHLGGFIGGIGCGLWLDARSVAAERALRADIRRRGLNDPDR